ncbi:MAG: aspartate aminotransferase family protein [Planctomycetes bacterium]|nr:aspartate aminotransferase family protein [Planctomycetota bacterium]
MWDAEGRRYLDFNAGFGSVNIGHNHPRMAARLSRLFTEEPLNFCHMGPARHAANLAEALCKRLGEPLSICLFCSSGAEAVEGALKIARLATGRTAFLSCEGAYHGLSLGTLSVMGEEHMAKSVGPLLADCQRVPFGDIEAARQALATERFAAFLVEPIQCEGGIMLPPPGYLAEVQRLCRAHGTLMVLDEVQTGFGRTGRMFAFQDEGFVPDVVTLAKSLSGAIAPIGATITSAAINKRAYGSMHNFELPFSTFGGNAYSCAVGLETLQVLEEEGLAANSKVRGEQLLRGLRERLEGHPLIRAIRGPGLLVGIEFGPTDQGILNRLCPRLVEMVLRGAFGLWVSVQLLERGFLCATATHRWDILRLEPPLTVTEERVETAINMVAEVLWQYRSVTSILRDVTRRLGRQWMRHWRF